MVRIANLRLETIGSNPGSIDYFFLGGMRFFFFFAQIQCLRCSHGSNLQKFAKAYNKRNINAQSACSKSQCASNLRQTLFGAILTQIVRNLGGWAYMGLKVVSAPTPTTTTGMNL